MRSLLSDPVDRGLDADRPRLRVIDGGKALRKAIVECFGVNALVQRCQEHKRRNVLELKWNRAGSRNGPERSQFNA